MSHPVDGSNVVFLIEKQLLTKISLSLRNVRFMGDNRKNTLTLTSEERAFLEKISVSYTEKRSRTERAKLLLMYADNKTKSYIARSMKMSYTSVLRCINKAVTLGIASALEDLPRSGRPPSIDEGARTWLVEIACRSPNEFDYPHELWTTRLLSEHIRKTCESAGHPCLKMIGCGTLSKILNSNALKPHKIRSYLNNHDPNFEERQREVLLFYKKVEDILNGESEAEAEYISYDEKPGIQALESKYPDNRSKEKGCLLRDPEYIRHGTLSLMAGIDLLTGTVHTQIVERHRSKEFIAMLKQLDAYYAEGVSINILLDNHIIHKSKETIAYLKKVPGRFTFTFTPKHSSWLNIIEVFFSKLARTVLRGIRVKSKQELRERMDAYFQDINIKPVKFRWKYKMDEI